MLNKCLIWLVSLLIDRTIVEQTAMLTFQCDCWMVVAHVAMKANWKKWNFVLRSVAQFCQHLWSVFAVNSMFVANSLLAALARAGKFAVIYHLLKHLSDKVRYFWIENRAKFHVINSKLMLKMRDSKVIETREIELPFVCFLESLMLHKLKGRQAFSLLVVQFSDLM